MVGRWGSDTPAASYVKKTKRVSLNFQDCMYVCMHVCINFTVKLKYPCCCFAEAPALIPLECSSNVDVEVELMHGTRTAEHVVEDVTSKPVYGFQYF